jgi:hypothetical protein
MKNKKQTTNLNNIIAESHQLNILVLQYIDKFNLKIYNGNIYKLQENSTYTYRFFIPLLDLKYELIKYYKEHFDLILKQFNVCYNFWYKSDILNNTNFSNFRYIEYKDFILDLNNGNRLSKEKFTEICFYYFNLDFKNFTLVNTLII